jgi:hypothetical protein
MGWIKQVRSVLWKRFHKRAIFVGNKKEGMMRRYFSSSFPTLLIGLARVLCMCELAS